ncbi:F-box protein [Aspergillus aculeatinus CBS 121060]|uniref:Uncharacterized protein n=1 Tax=Aspergillus aculeatinus CBS 121060 TaxID=1448322 RepID=A0ACD1H466_9EURO|nr:hypothetical protein BO66DRAFT_377758 [Aspergillus aculeatinus CBS 121060]RAH68411.1 hypothetical protein BO66DRAFT_377758 [Aspergillus aculeatinus CBS 121060]
MGYSEAYCHFCGVSFNIGRARDVGEPHVASFGSDDSLSMEIEDLDLAECAKKGCVFALKYPYPGEKDDDLEVDPDYQPEEYDDGADEPYEYDSDYESDKAMSLSEDHHDDDTQQGETTTTEDEEEELYRDFLSNTLRTLNPRHYTGEPIGGLAYSKTTGTKKDILIPITFSELPEDCSPEDLEHIPAPTCGQPSAYPGSAISVAEMRGCRTAQFLVHKSQTEGTWKPDGLHENWETDAEWFISGVCDGMRSRDCGYPDVWPARGGVETVAADNVNFGSMEPHELAMPFHPWCFDIFSRQSKRHFNKVNVDGLIKWRDAECSYEEFHEFPRAGDVLESQEQWWDHKPGREYLAANPLYVPGLPALLVGATSQEQEVEVSNATFENAERTHPDTCVVDHLSSLPLDLRLHIISFLDAADITRLRAASRAFTHLPNGVWYRLVRDEMPWLWEAWNDSEIEHTPSWWTMVNANEVKFVNDTRNHYAKVLGAKPPDQVDLVDHLVPWPAVMPEQVRLERANTDWHRVFTRVKSQWARLKGLRNRRRIWEDVEEIIRRIERCEGSG